MKPPTLALLALPAPPDITEYQCVVCHLIKKSATEMHQHQSSHTPEQLSLVIIGTQILYHIAKFSEKKVTDFKLKQEAPSPIFPPSSPVFVPSPTVYPFSSIVSPPSSSVYRPPLTVTRLPAKVSLPPPTAIRPPTKAYRPPTKVLPPPPTVYRPSPTVFRPSSSQTAYSEIQNEPLNLKVVKNAKNPSQDLKTDLKSNISSSKTRRNTALFKKKIAASPGCLKVIKEIPVAPGPSKKEPKIQPGGSNIVLEGRKKISERVSTSHDDNRNPDKILSTKEESFTSSQHVPIFHNFAVANLYRSIEADKVKKKLIVKNPKVDTRKVADFTIFEQIIERPELVIKKTEANKPEKKIEVKKPDIQLFPLIQKMLLKRPFPNSVPEFLNVSAFKTPEKRIQEPLPQKLKSEQIPPKALIKKTALGCNSRCLKPPLQKSNPKILEDTAFKKPATKIQVEPLRKKQKCEQFPPKGKKEKTSLRDKSPVVIIGDDAWFEFKKRLFSQRQLPIITNITEEDFSSQSFEKSKNSSENFNYDHLVNGDLAELDSYLLLPENQPEEGFHSCVVSAEAQQQEGLNSCMVSAEVKRQEGLNYAPITPEIQPQDRLNSFMMSAEVQQKEGLNPDLISVDAQRQEGLNSCLISPESQTQKD